MMRACPADFARLAGYLGFSCDDESWVKLRNPLTLAHWTMPVVELLMLVGAALALAYALRRVRRDPTGIAIWLASLVYAVATELPRHPPDIFAGTRLGVMLVHNVFSVDFVDGRLPLYIVALYPATITLAYDIVRATGVFERRGAVVGAICVGFVHGCVYGVFDHLGPQLRWWVWNTANPLNHPTLGCVPVSSWVSLAVVGPAWPRAHHRVRCRWPGAQRSSACWHRSSWGCSACRRCSPPTTVRRNTWSSAWRWRYSRSWRCRSSFRTGGSRAGSARSTRVRTCGCSACCTC
jgi:hypothetical protein